MSIETHKVAIQHAHVDKATGKKVEALYEERVVPGTESVAFRCKTCGCLHTSAYAGAADHPHACRICDEGIRYFPSLITATEEMRKVLDDPTYQAIDGVNCRFIGPRLYKVWDRSAWEVLHDATDERLTELGLDRKCVAKHVPGNSGVANVGPAQNIRRDVTEGSAVGEFTKAVKQ